MLAGLQPRRKRDRRMKSAAETVIPEEAEELPKLDGIDVAAGAQAALGQPENLSEDPPTVRERFSGGG